MKNRILFVLLLLAEASFSQTFIGGSGPILDNQTIDIPVSVSGLQTTIDTNNFGLETVCFDATHTWDADVSFWIIAPDGSIAQLFANIGGGDDNFTNTCLNQDASQSITSANAPFTGTFKPAGQMGLVNNGQNPNGTWFLRVSDNYGADEGMVNSFSLTFGNNPATYFDFKSSLLPIVSIETNGGIIDDDIKIVADMEIRWQTQGTRNYLTDPVTHYEGKIGIEYRGNYSLSLPQKPYAFETQDVNGNNLDTSLLGMPSENDWVLLANFNDKSFARNIVPYHLFDSMGHYATRTRLVDVVLNGEYQGIYLLGEKIKRDQNRVDVANLQPVDITVPEVTGGYLLKFDYWDNSNSWQLNYSPIGFPGLDVHMVHYQPAMNELMPEQLCYIHNYVDDFEDALYGTNFSDPNLGYRAYIGTKSFIDYFLISELTRNVDGYKKSRFFYKDKNDLDGTVKKLKAGPVWDFDWSQKDINGGSEDGSGWMYPYCDQDVNAEGWYIRLLEDDLFADELKCRYEDLRRTILSEDYIFDRIDSVANLVNESQNWHYLVWGHMGAATGTGEVQAPSQNYAQEVQRLKDWYHRRLEWLDANMPGTLQGCSMTGMEDLVATGKINAFPVPLQDQLQVDWSETDIHPTHLRMIDASGRVIRELPIINLSSKAIVLGNLQDLNNGWYMIELIEGEKIGRLKVVK
ncbi:MAG: CotH kinase family protein [Bacteroidota bacterium]